MLWSRIEKNLEPKEPDRRGGLLWFWSLLGVCLIGGLSYYFYNMSNENERLTIHDIHVNPHEQQVQQAATNTTLYHEQKLEQIDDDFTLGIEKITSEKKSSARNPSTEKTRENNQYPIKNQDRQSRGNETLKIENSSPRQSESSLYVYEGGSVISSKIKASTVIRLPSVLTFPLYSQRRVLSTPEINADQKIEIVEKKNPTWKLAMLGGLYNTHRSTKVDRTSSSEINSYLAKRDAATQVVETWQSGIAISKTIGSIEIATGVNYSRSYELFRYADQVVITQPMWSDSGLVRTYEGLVTYEPGIVNKTTTLKTQIESPNHLQRWSIPVTIAYRMPIQRLTVSPYVGMSIDLYNKYTGLQYALDGKVRSSKSSDWSEIYRRSGVSTVSAGVKLDYRLYSSWNLYMQVGGSQDLSSVSKYYDERYRMLGVSLGLGYQW
jgi:hypothetical protein